MCCGGFIGNVWDNVTGAADDLVSGAFDLVTNTAKTIAKNPLAAIPLAIATDGMSLLDTGVVAGVGEALTPVIGSDLAATLAPGIVGGALNAGVATISGSDPGQAFLAGALGGTLSSTAVGDTVTNMMGSTGAGVISDISSATGLTPDQVSANIYKSLGSAVSAGVSGKDPLQALTTSLASSSLGSYTQNIVNSIDPGKLTQAASIAGKAVSVASNAGLNNGNVQLALQNNIGTIIGAGSKPSGALPSDTSTATPSDTSSQSALPTTSDTSSPLDTTPGGYAAPSPTNALPVASDTSDAVTPDTSSPLDTTPGGYAAPPPEGSATGLASLPSSVNTPEQAFQTTPTPTVDTGGLPVSDFVPPTSSGLPQVNQAQSGTTESPTVDTSAPSGPQPPEITQSDTGTTTTYGQPTELGTTTNYDTGTSTTAYIDPNTGDVINTDSGIPVNATTGQALPGTSSGVTIPSGLPTTTAASIAPTSTTPTSTTSSDQIKNPEWPSEPAGKLPQYLTPSEFTVQTHEFRPVLSPLVSMQQLVNQYPQLAGANPALLNQIMGKSIHAAHGGHISGHPTAAPNEPVFKTGHYVTGKGDGQSDDIPAMLADGEYVFDADTVASLGNGSNKAGAEVLDKFREAIRAHKRSAGIDKIPPKAKKLTSYLKEAERG